MTEWMRSVRLRRSLLAASAIGLLCASVAPAVSAGASDQQPRQPADSPERQAAVPIPAVESVETLANGPRYETAPDGTVYSPLDEPAFIRGHDNGQSALYDNGEGLRFSYWSFGDTFLTEPNGDGDTFLANTGALTTDFDLSNSISDWWYDGGDGAPREFIGLDADERAWNDQHKDTDPNADGCQPAAGVEWMDCGNELAIWGGSIVADPDRKRILAFYGLIERIHVLKDGCTQDDIDNQNEACRELSFDGRAHGVAVWTEQSSDGEGWTRQLVENSVDPDSPYSIWPHDDDPGSADLVFDKGMVTATAGGEEFLYAYGCPGQLTSECRVARAPWQATACGTGRPGSSTPDRTATPSTARGVGRSTSRARSRCPLGRTRTAHQRP